MSNKEIAVTLILKMPNGATLMEIARMIRFVAGIRQGAKELDRGEGVLAEVVRPHISKWAGYHQ